MKIYTATKLTNVDAARAINRVLVAAGHEITYDWAVHGSMQDSPDQWSEVSRKEMDGVRSADLVVVILPGGRGTHAEMGAGIALSKPVLILGQKAVFEEGGYTCAFYHHPTVRKEVVEVFDLSVIAALILKHAGALEEARVG